jgi:hypothetical protein
VGCQLRRGSALFEQGIENGEDAAMLAVDTGMRLNPELFPLQWCDVHLDALRKHHKAQYTCERERLANSVRNIPLTPRTREVLGTRKELTGSSSK